MHPLAEHTHTHTHTHAHAQVLGVPKIVVDRLVVDTVIFVALYELYVYFFQ